jgi:hypothetical protein
MQDVVCQLVGIGMVPGYVMYRERVDSTASVAAVSGGGGGGGGGGGDGGGDDDGDAAA